MYDDLSTAYCDQFFYHFTSLESLERIVDSSCINLSHISYMNDPLDGIEIFECICEELILYIEKVNEMNLFNEVSDLLLRPISSGLMDKFTKKINNAEKRGCSPYFLLLSALKFYKKFMSNNFDVSGNIFILSLVRQKKDDNVHLWEVYGNKGRGVRLEFDPEELKRIIGIIPKDTMKKWGLHDVIYFSNSEMKNISNLIIDEVIRGVKNISMKKERKYFIYLAFARDVLYLSAIFKNHSYSAEREVRLVLLPSSSENIGFYIKNENELIPYYSVFLDKFKQKYVGAFRSVEDGIISKITAGPLCDEKLTTSLDFYLRSNGVHSVLIDRSIIKYRGK